MPEQPSPLSRPSRAAIVCKALRELGLGQLSLYALYQLELRSGYLYRATNQPPTEANQRTNLRIQSVLPIPGRQALEQVLGEAGQKALLAEAGEILAGRVRLFGGQPVSLNLAPPAPVCHWTAYERGIEKVAPTGDGETGSDIKFIWEPARLGWAFTLGRAYLLTGDDRHADAFWGLLEAFLDANPPYLGLNWVSAQETGLRLLALTFAGQVFASSSHSTPVRKTVAQREARLAWAIETHATRIPPTLFYARAQNNNHLLSEAAGLYTAALALPAHPAAARWRKLGWSWFQRGLRAQIASDGAYSQHSANYQRLMLQLALWMNALASQQGQAFPAVSQSRLAAATRWLLNLLNPQSGNVPNLGPNDGAYILPLAGCSFADYRPTLQAAGLAFLGEQSLPAGVWDELSLWMLPAAHLNNPPPGKGLSQSDVHRTPHVLVSPGGDSWAYLRVAHFSGRPGHADQLHLDLWRRGLNLAQDAGTFLYNAPPPWDNRLAGCEVHNTVTVDEQDQMIRAGRFLYLERAQAQVIAGEPASPTSSRPGAWSSLTARHDGYRHLQLVHQRAVSALPSGDWLVEDALLPIPKRFSAPQAHAACLHWLLPDWPWQAQCGESDLHFILRLETPHGTLQLELWVKDSPDGAPVPAQLQIVRAGELIYGSGAVKPTWGWMSPTYGDKMPALAVRVLARRLPPFYFTSEWSLAKLVSASNPELADLQVPMALHLEK